MPRHPSERERTSLLILDHGLDPRLAQEPAGGLRVDDGSALEVGAARHPPSPAPYVHHDGGPVGVRVLADPRRAQRHERIGLPRARIDGILLAGHRRDLLGDPLERLGDDRALRRGQLGLHPEPRPVLPYHHVRKRWRSASRTSSTSCRTARSARRRTEPTRRARRPRDQSVLGLELGEPRELHDLVDAERSCGERVRERGQRLERVRGRSHRRAFHSETP